jgi:hypothetical protein
MTTDGWRSTRGAASRTLPSNILFLLRRRPRAHPAPEGPYGDKFKTFENDEDLSEEMTETDTDEMTDTMWRQRQSEKQKPDEIHEKRDKR